MKLDLLYVEQLVRGNMVYEMKLYLQPIAQQLEDWKKQNSEYEATAARRLELLRRGLEPLNNAEYRIWVEDVKKELADD